MREILFRGKAVKSGEWHYGMWCDEGYDADFPCIVPKDGADVDPGDWKVERSTVGQYTGLTDKNGKRIFEGDIALYTNGDGEHSVYLVLWNHHRWLAKMFGGCPALPDDLDEGFCRDAEVIGNIYDNPELIGGVSDERA